MGFNLGGTPRHPGRSWKPKPIALRLLVGTPRRRGHRSAVASAAPGREQQSDTPFCRLDFGANPVEHRSACPVSSHPLVPFLIFSVLRGFRPRGPPGIPIRTENPDENALLILCRKGQFSLEEVAGLRCSVGRSPVFRTKHCI